MMLVYKKIISMSNNLLIRKIYINISHECRNLLHGTYDKFSLLDIGELPIYAFLSLLLLQSVKLTAFDWVNMV